MISNTMLVSFCHPIPNCWNCSASQFPYMVVLTWVCEFSGVLCVGDTGICDDVGQEQRSHWLWVSWLGFVDAGTGKLYYHWLVGKAWGTWHSWNKVPLPEAIANGRPKFWECPVLRALPGIKPNSWILQHGWWQFIDSMVGSYACMGGKLQNINSLSSHTNLLYRGCVHEGCIEWNKAPTITLANFQEAVMK